jgi:hypothetical protein
MNPTVRSLYETHDGLLYDKWSSYLDVYEETFSSFRDKPIRLLEIGVQNGGFASDLTQIFPKRTRDAILTRALPNCGPDPA